jgi:hypothetical protein
LVNLIELKVLVQALAAVLQPILGLLVSDRVDRVTTMLFVAEEERLDLKTFVHPRDIKI